MVSITCYGGVGEIGGNKLLLEDGGSRLFLDFGLSFGTSTRFYSDFLQPKKYNSIPCLLDTGLLPALPDMAGLYRSDYLGHCDMACEAEPAYHGVLLSHAHMDHAAYVHFLRHDIPLYASEVTRRILAASETTSSGSFKEYVSFGESFALGTGSKGAPKRLKASDLPKQPRPFTEMPAGKRVEAGGFVVEAWPVNHSIPGARAYIIHTSSGPVVYSGDLRFHGYAGDLTRAFVRRAAAVRPALMLCEGTRIDLSDQTGEQDVFERVAEQIRRTKALVLADYPFRDIERVTTFYRAAKECGRRLAIDLRQAYLLGALQGSDAGAPAPTDPHIAIYVRRKNWGLITKDGYPPTIVDADYDVWERPFLLLDNAVTCDDIRRDQDQYVLHLDFFELTDLVDIRPAPGSCFVRSVTEPHDEEDEIDLERVRNWLALYGLMPYLQVHASGHASGPELTELVRDISPRVLVPIHTEQPQRFADELAGTGIEVRLPVCAEPIVF